MQKNEIPQFTTLWLSIAETYLITLSENAVAIACDALRDYPLEAIKNACQGHIRDTNQGKYMPKPAQIIESINSARNRKQVYKRLEDNRVESFVSRNECVFHIKKLLPNFKTWEERNPGEESVFSESQDKS